MVFSRRKKFEFGFIRSHFAATERELDPSTIYVDLSLDFSTKMNAEHRKVAACVVRLERSKTVQLRVLHTFDENVWMRNYFAYSLISEVIVRLS